MRKHISDPDFVYRPWSAARRKAAIKAAAVRLYGSERNANKARATKLKELLARRAVLKAELGRVESHIRSVERQLIKSALL